MTDKKAAAIYGLYTAGVYLMALPGGWIADRIFGQRNAVFLGGCIIAAGHFSMALPMVWSFYLGLCLIVFGTGTSETERQRDGRRPLSRGRRAAGLRLFLLLHGDQHGRVHRSAHLRRARRTGQLALGVRCGRGRHGLRLDPVPIRPQVPRNGGPSPPGSHGRGSAEPRHPAGAHRHRCRRRRPRRTVRFRQRHRRVRRQRHGRRHREQPHPLFRRGPAVGWTDGSGKEADRRHLHLLSGLVALLGGL